MNGDEVLTQGTRDLIRDRQKRSVADEVEELLAATESAAQTLRAGPGPAAKRSLQTLDRHVAELARECQQTQASLSAEAEQHNPEIKRLIDDLTGASRRLAEGVTAERAKAGGTASAQSAQQEKEGMARALAAEMRRTGGSTEVETARWLEAVLRGVDD